MTAQSVCARLAPGRAVGDDTFADLTTAVVVDVSFEPDGWLRVTFDRDLSASEAAAVRRRIASSNAADEKVRADAEAFLAKANPTLQEVADAVKRLTRLELRLTDQPPGEPAPSTSASSSSSGVDVNITVR